MLKKFIAIVSLFIMPSMLFACRSPDNVFAIHFNNNEAIDGAPIDKLGELNVNYFKAESKPVYTFRSHFQPSIMVVLDSEKKKLEFTADTSKVKLDQLMFDRYVKTELDWLNDAGVVALSRINREKAENAFKQKGKGAKGSIYYTQQDTLVHSSNLLTDDGKFIPVDCGTTVYSKVTLPPKNFDISTKTNPKKHSVNIRQLPSHVTSSSATYFDTNGRLYPKNVVLRSSPQHLLIYRNTVAGSVQCLLPF